MKKIPVRIGCIGAFVLALSGMDCSQRSDRYLGDGVRKESDGDLNGAIKEYDKAIALNPNYAGPYYARGLSGSLAKFLGLEYRE